MSQTYQPKKSRAPRPGTIRHGKASPSGLVINSPQEPGAQSHLITAYNTKAFRAPASHPLLAVIKKKKLPPLGCRQSIAGRSSGDPPHPRLIPRARRRDPTPRSISCCREGMDVKLASVSPARTHHIIPLHGKPRRTCRTAGWRHRREALTGQEREPNPIADRR
jgi:hypothetical protein